MKLKTIALLTVVMAMGTTAFAETMKSMPEEEAKKIITLVDSAHTVYDDGSNLVRLVVLDHGLGTDFGPRYSLVLTVNSYGESLNLGTAFDLGWVYDFHRVMNQNGLEFSILYKDYEPESQHGFVSKMFNIDLKKVMEYLKNHGREQFDDGYFQSEIEIESVIPG